jgi:hypothetical protein
MSDSLLKFPRHPNDVYLYQLGSERTEDRWAYYVRFRVFTTDSVGHCAIQLRFNNNQGIPEREISEFCIRAETGAINRLGTLIQKFAQLKHAVLFWTPHGGSLYVTEEEAEEGTPANS